MEDNKMSTSEFRNRVFRRYKNMGVPVEGVFEITGRCTFNCKMCYVHTMPNAEFLKKEKSGDWWISQIDEACKHGMLFALLTGGECMLHPDFKTIYTHLRSRGVYTSINTNGFLLTDEMISFLKENPPFEIQMTLYGTDDESYEAVTGVRAFRAAEAAIERLQKAGLNFKIAVTPNPYASGETERIVTYLRERKLPFGVNQGLFTPYSDEIPQTLSEQEVAVDEKIRILQAVKGQPVEPISEHDLPPAGGGKTGLIHGAKCSGGCVTFFMNWEGHMQMCGTFYHCRIPVHTAEDFLPAWQKVQEINRNYLAPVECEGCAYKNACFSCPVLRSGKVGNGHCDPAVCELTRKLVASGVKKLKQKPQSCEGDTD